MSRQGGLAGRGRGQGQGGPRTGRGAAGSMDSVPPPSPLHSRSLACRFHHSLRAHPTPWQVPAPGRLPARGPLHTRHRSPRAPPACRHLHLDACLYEDPAICNDLYLQPLRAPYRPGAAAGKAFLRRFTLDLHAPDGAPARGARAAAAGVVAARGAAWRGAVSR